MLRKEGITGCLQLRQMQIEFSGRWCFSVSSARALSRRVRQNRGVPFGADPETVVLAYLLNTALSTSRTPIAPTKRDWSSKSATGAV